MKGEFLIGYLGRSRNTINNVMNYTLQTRENFDASRADIQALMRKMLEVRQSVSNCSIRRKLNFHPQSSK